MDRKITWGERAKNVVNRMHNAFPQAEFENWGLCEEFILCATAICEQISQFEIETENAAMLLHETAYYLYQKSEYDQAEYLYKKSLAIDGKALGKDHLSIAVSLNNLAALYVDQGDYDQAEPLYQRSLTIRKMALGEGHSEVAASLNNLAGLYRRQGKYDQAQSLCQKKFSNQGKSIRTRSS